MEYVERAEFQALKNDLENILLRIHALETAAANAAAPAAAAANAAAAESKSESDSTIVIHSDSPGPAVSCGQFGEPEFTIGGILSHRVEGGQLQYRVHWEGYDASKDSWEPAVDLRADVPDIVSRYDALHGVTH